MFITFEGIDGSGKSTQIKFFEKYLNNKNIKTVLTREPGGCPVSNKIRDVLVKGTPDTMDMVTELLLVNAARREHIKQHIKPELSLNKTVIVDRFIDSTLAYQGDVGKEVIHGFHRQLCFGLYPDLVFYIDLDPVIGFTRETHPEESRFEKKGLIYMSQVRDRFLKRATDNPDTHVILNGELPIEEIHKQIFKEYNDRTKI